MSDTDTKRVRLRDRQEIKFFGALQRAAPALSTTWWILLLLRGLLAPVVAIATGVLIGAVNGGHSLTGPLVFVGVVFVLYQVVTPLHQAVSSNLGSRASSWLNDQLLRACTAPPGMRHLEDPELTNDLTMARDFDLGISGPPLTIAMDFIATGLVDIVAGIGAAIVLFGFSWWAPLVLVAAWSSTHWLLRESGVWRDRNTDEVRDAQRHAEYAYRIAVDPPAAKELRLFGLAPWVVERFTARRRRLYELQWNATRLRERPVLGCLLIVLAANLLVFIALANAAADGTIALGQVVVYLQTAIGTSAIAFGGLSWALDGAAAPVAAVLRLEAAMATEGALPEGTRPAADMPAREIRFRDVTFAYTPDAPRAVLEHFDLTIPAGTSLAIVGQNGAGKTTLAKLLCRLYDPQGGAIEIDGVDLRDLRIEDWRARVTAVFQDFVRYELSLRENVMPRTGDRSWTGTDDAAISAALADAGAADLASLGTILARGYEGGIDLSGGQWQRIALARALCAVHLGAGVVLLDEPTAHLDVRGEAEIFERILAATRACTTILVSHRFSTVRHADRICVLEHGRVIELGTHDELMALRGRYHTMFDLQAARFAGTAGPVEYDESGEEVVYDTLG
jgi:ABC-type multidrug transport system fused ATPase/permease subunit